MAEKPEALVARLLNLIPSKTHMGFITCPACTGVSTVPVIIIHLNDGHKWSREDIADWLETLDLDLTIGGEDSWTAGP
jgi:hypothetical protein